jgi:hypothetical protein
MKWLWVSIPFGVVGLTLTICSHLVYPERSFGWILGCGIGLVLVWLGTFILGVNADDILDAWADRKLAKQEASKTKEEES